MIPCLPHPLSASVPSLSETPMQCWDQNEPQLHAPAACFFDSTHPLARKIKTIDNTMRLSPPV